ncbi:MAG: adenylyl-sulfate kinase [Bacteriovorax sp.]|jgi:bifunctional enzyme CysN/CysC
MSAGKTIRVVIAGHVDHGKSTLVGRLLSDTGQIFPERIEKVKKICDGSGKKFEFAFLLDAFEEEQKEGITIDKTEIPWSYKDQDFLIIDTPGHKEFLKNMISGATTANAAVIMLDAAEGVRDQFKRHAYIIGMLGIKNIIVVINKMDLVNFDESHFKKLEEESRSIFKELKIAAVNIIPVSAFLGENLLNKSDKLPWYKGPTFAEVLLNLATKKESSTHSAFRFSLQDVYKFDDNRIYAGKIESGSLSVGDEIKFLPSGSSSKIKSIEEWNAKTPPTTAPAGTSVGFTLTDALFLERGEMGFKPHEAAPTLTHQMHASLFWMGKNHLSIGKNYKFKMLTQQSDCKIESIFRVFNPESFNTRDDESIKLDTGEAAEVIIKFQKNIVCDAFSANEGTGRFVLLEDHRIVGGGVVINPNTINVFKEKSHLSAMERSKRFGHQGAVIWLTGLSGAGKSTIAKVLEKKLFEMNTHSIVLDGDNLRKGICKDLGFSDADRKENIRRTGEVAKLIAESGAVSIAALISPFSGDRQIVREMMNASGIGFIEIFVDCSLKVCEARDTKGLYKKARKGEIKGFTGIASDYEAPVNPEIIIKSDSLSPEASVDKIIEYMTKAKLIGQKNL